jgi:nucleotide-binding universal stress UspA family protein
MKVIWATDGSGNADPALPFARELAGPYRARRAVGRAKGVVRAPFLPDVFERVVCGIDGSPESLEALRQVERLRPETGELHLVAVAELRLAVHGGFAAPRIYDEIARAAESALAQAAEHCEAASARLAEGEPARVLRQEIDRVQATAVALGNHHRSRGAGILMGNTATTLLHEAPCSVLLARPPAASLDFPSSIVVGVDGSDAAGKAYDVARELGERVGVPVRALAASGGKDVDLEVLRRISALGWNERKPANALVDASRETDLLVVGSRGLHGLSALGSVSERVAHRAASSVLVVRPRDAG